MDNTGDVTVSTAAACTGESATVANATFTTALTVDTGTLTLTANAANNSVLTIGAGASSISGANTGDNTVCTSGTATTAATLATPRAIGGVNFDGSAAITPTTIAVTDTADTTCWVGLWESATGNLLPQTDAVLLYNAGTGALSATSFVGAAAAGTLSGTTLKSTVVTSSLTSLGTIGSLVATTADINGGTLDGVQIGATTATGELFVNNASDDADGLGSQGTDGQVLTSVGPNANPAWEDAGGGGWVVDDTQVVTDGRYADWVDIDLSAIVGAKATLVMFSVRSDTATNVGVRPNGYSTPIRPTTGVYGGGCAFGSTLGGVYDIFLLVATGTDGKVEYYQPAAAYTDIWLRGYLQ